MTSAQLFMPSIKIRLSISQITDQQEVYKTTRVQRKQYKKTHQRNCSCICSNRNHYNKKTCKRLSKHLSSEGTTEVEKYRYFTTIEKYMKRSFTLNEMKRLSYRDIYKLIYQKLVI